MRSGRDVICEGWVWGAGGGGGGDGEELGVRVANVRIEGPLFLLWPAEWFKVTSLLPQWKDWSTGGISPGENNNLYALAALNSPFDSPPPPDSPGFGPALFQSQIYLFFKADGGRSSCVGEEKKKDINIHRETFRSLTPHLLSLHPYI